MRPPTDALEFRPRDNGTFDEIVARFADGMVHVETMSNTSCYVGFYWDDGRYCQWWINSGKKLEYHHEHGVDKPPRFTSQGIDTHSAKTEGLGPKDESPVGGNADAPTPNSINQGEAEILREVEWSDDLTSAPSACHVLACRFDHEAGEWIIHVAMSPPSKPFTHWAMLPAMPNHPRARRKHVTELSNDVRRLVIAARNVAYGNASPDQEAMTELDRASEAFAALVPWENEEGVTAQGGEG